MNNENNDSTASDSLLTKPVWRELFRTTEGRILLLGIAIALTGLIIMGLVAFWSPLTARMMGAMSFSNIFFGMIVSMSIGYAAGYDHLLVISVNMWVETVVVLLFYPIFVLSMRKLVDFPKLGRFLERTQSTAERHHETVRRYGVIGLFMFVWIPFWMTGPIVGCAIGYLLGLPAWLTLGVVIIGNLFTMLTWAVLLFSLYTHAAVFGPWAPVLIIGIVIFFILAGYLLNLRKKKSGIMGRLSSLLQRIKIR